MLSSEESLLVLSNKPSVVAFFVVSYIFCSSNLCVRVIFYLFTFLFF